MARDPNLGPDLAMQVLSDFSAGLYERGNDRECPPNGLLEASNCYPLPYGGLRAGPALQPISQAGLTSGANSTGGSVPMGIFAMVGITNANPIFLSEFQVDEGGSGVHRLRMMNLSGESTGALSTGTWTPVFTSSGITQFAAGTKVATMRNQTNFYKMYFDLCAVPQAKSGIYNFTTSTSSMAFAANGPHGLVATQGRLVFITHETTVYGVPNQIEFTNYSTDAAPSTVTNVIAPLVEQSLPLQWIYPFSPNDLIGLKLGRGLFDVQGDITASDTPTRELSFDHNVSDMYPTPTDVGLAFQVQGQGIYAHSGGLSIKPLSEQILGDPFSSTEMGAPNWTGISFNYRGQLAFTDGRLYAGKYVYDTRTGAWWKITGQGTTYASPTAGGKPAYAAVDVSNQRIYFANYGRMLPGSTRQLLWWTPAAENDWIRSTAFQATFPLIDLETRNVEIRRIEIFGQGFGSGGTWTISLTNESGGIVGSTRSASVPAAAASAVFNVRGYGDWVKLRVQSAGTSTSEAPMIQRIALYTQPRAQRSAL